MKINNQSEYIRYRFERAEESFDEAIILSEHGKWNAVVNRLYYACFYAVISLLLKNGIETQSHDGARTQFGLNFVKTGKVSKEYGKLFSKLFDFRQKGDYGDLYDFDSETVKPLISKTKEFIQEVKSIVIIDS